MNAQRDDEREGRSRLIIQRTWDGDWRGEMAHVSLERWRDAVRVEIDAPFFGDPAPGGSGRHPRLWEYEVVEVFFAETRNRDSQYFELELGPHGHYLALAFEGYRRVVDMDIALEVDARIYTAEEGLRWQAAVALPQRWVAAAKWCNAYMIHGQPGRDYRAAFPVEKGRYPGPDFHRLEHFGPLEW